MSTVTRYHKNNLLLKYRINISRLVIAHMYVHVPYMGK